MASSRVSRRSRRRRSKPGDMLPTPRGVIHPRVQKVGPEHFGIVAVDCAKARSKWMLTDFYGNVLVSPTEVEHNRNAFATAIAVLRAACRRHAITDQIVAIERTGRYHHVPQRAFRDAGFETRIVHPFSSKQYRQTADSDNKTDDTDLAGIQRAAVAGFALVEPEWDDAQRELQLLVRQRRDLVEKRTALQCQMREHLDAALPGYAACFEDFWDSPVALPLVRRAESAEEIRALGRDGILRLLRDPAAASPPSSPSTAPRLQARVLDRVLAWAARAARPDTAAARHRLIALQLDSDRLQKSLEIQDLERDLAARVARTPYILLLSLVGVNVVSVADSAGEIGPMHFYLNGRTITGRAGLFPARYQSDRVDRANGPLVRRGNRAVRAVLLRVADNLIICNRYFRTLASAWKAHGDDPRLIRTRIGARYSRIAFQIVAGRQLFRHPCAQGRGYVLQKLIAFHREHDTPMTQVLADLEAAVAQLPATAYTEEAAPLADELQRIRSGGRRGPQPLGDILPAVLARLGVTTVQSKASGGVTPA